MSPELQAALLVVSVVLVMGGVFSLAVLIHNARERRRIQRFLERQLVTQVRAEIRSQSVCR